jgi:cell division transport system permease protein
MSARPTPQNTFAQWREHHKREAGNSLKRLISHPIGSLMTLLLVALALALPAALFTLLADAQSVINKWDGQAQISLYLKPDISPEHQQTLLSYIQNRGDVGSARLVSPEAALAEFRDQSGFGSALDLLPSNPLPPVIIVRPLYSQSKLVRQLSNELSNREEVSSTDVDLTWISRLNALLDLGKTILIGLVLIMAATILLVISNITRLEVESRREEVRILTLLGATNGFIRRPFLYTGFWIGLLGGILASITLVVFMLVLQQSLESLAVLYSSHFNFSGPNPLIVIGLIIISTLLGMFAAGLAVGKHLRFWTP